MINKEADLIEQLNKNPDLILVKLYKEYRQEFLSWAYKTYGADKENSSDSFQDAMIILYKNVQTKKLMDLQSSIKTYLFSIGRNILLTKYKAAQRLVPLKEDSYQDISNESLEFPELYEGNSLENRIADIIQSMQDPCKSILRFFYFRGYSMDEIASEMNYKNAQTVKSQKVRCIKEIQHLIKRKMRVNI